MKSLMYMLSALAVMGLAFWAYHENYKTQAALDEVQELQHEIGSLLETRSVLNAEWAYLNRPDRLRDLAELNYEELQLVPLQPEQFGQIDQIAYPPITLELDNIVEVIGVMPGAETEADDAVQE